MALRVLVTGGRHYRDIGAVDRALSYIATTFGLAAVIHGDCHLGGADRLAKDWCRARGVVEIGYPVVEAVDGAWPYAGPNRNARMLADSKPDVGLAFPGDKGTRDMTDRLRKAGLEVWEMD